MKENQEEGRGKERSGEELEKVEVDEGKEGERREVGGKRRGGRYTVSRG